MKIVIVENDPFKGSAIQPIVKEVGFEGAEIFEAATQAVDYIKEHPVNILILDISLKGQDALDVAGRIKSLKDIPVIYVSESPDNETLTGLLQTGSDAYLVKPFTAAELNIALHLALQKKKLQSKLAETENKLFTMNMKQEETRELERKRIAQEVHDAIGQELVGLKLTLDQMSRGVHTHLPASAKSTCKQINTLKGAVLRMMENTEKLTGQLRPPFIDEIGIIGSISREVNRLNSVTDNITIWFNCSGGEFDMDSDLLLPLYRIFQEATTNALKHAAPTHIDINLTNDGKNVSLVIKDDGRGFAKNQLNGHEQEGMGLLGMQERAKGLGGNFTIKSSSVTGTTITVNLPMHKTLEL